MKKFFNLLGIFMLAFLACSCSDDNSPEPEGTKELLGQDEFVKAFSDNVWETQPGYLYVASDGQTWKEDDFPRRDAYVGRIETLTFTVKDGKIRQYFNDDANCDLPVYAEEEYTYNPQTGEVFSQLCNDHPDKAFFEIVSFDGENLVVKFLIGRAVTLDWKGGKDDPGSYKLLTLHKASPEKQAEYETWPNVEDARANQSK